jgi:hypothetical protein
VVIVFKASSIYRMRYVGDVPKWTVELIADGIGASGPHAALVCGDSILFIGASGPYIFDGATFRPAGVDDVGDVTAGTAVKASCYWPATRSAWFYFNGPTTKVYNLSTDQWGLFTAYKSSSTTALSTYVLLTGVPSALAASVAGYTEASARLIDAALNPCVLALTAKWGAQGSVGAQVATNIMGQGGDVDTLFSRVTPQLKSHLFAGANQGNEATGTQMALEILMGSAPLLQNFTPPAFSPVTSSTTQCRFDFTLATKFAQFALDCSVAPFEVADLTVNAKLCGSS